MAPEDTFDMVMLGDRQLPAADSALNGEVFCHSILTAARYILDSKKTYLWSYTRDHTVQKNGPCLRSVLTEDEDGSYRIAGDSIELRTYDDGEAYRGPAGRLVGDTLELVRKGRRELYVRHR